MASGLWMLRLSLFLHKGRDFDYMSPVSDALHQHLLWVALGFFIETQIIGFLDPKNIHFDTNIIILALTEAEICGLV